MTVSNTKVHENLVALSAILTSNKKCLSEQPIVTVAPEADIVQISKFATSIDNICIKLQQIAALNEHTGEYIETIENIRTNIQCINDIGAELGFSQDIISMPTNTKETIDAAIVIHHNVALPYLLNANEESNIDYARYLIKQEEKHFLARAMQHLNSQIAKNEKYDLYVRAYWRTQKEAVMNYNRLAYLFLKGCEIIAQYEVDINVYRKAGTHNQNVLFALDKMIAMEKRMLKAGHVNEERQTLLCSIFEHGISSNTFSTTDEQTYFSMVRTQKQESPTFTMGDLESCAGILKTIMGNMNEHLRKANIMPLTTSMNALDTLKAGKLICDFTYDITKTSEENMSHQYQLAVQRWAKDITMKFKEAVFGSKELSSIKTQTFDNAKKHIVAIVTSDIHNDDGIISEADCINRRGQLTMLENMIVTAVGHTILPADPQYMLNVEVNVATDALKIAVVNLRNEGLI